MVGAVTSAATATSMTGGRIEPQSVADRARDILSWATPDGMLLHAVQPGLAEALRRSGVGANTEWGASL